LILGNRAQAQLRAGRPVRALQDVEEARRLDAGSTKLLLRRAACRLAMDQGEEAEADCRAALLADPNCEAARRALGGLGVEGEWQGRGAYMGGAGEWAAGARRIPPPPAGGIDAYEELGLTPLATYSQV
jgi:tetratricopeptide (TPR) repeat protein